MGRLLIIVGVTIVLVGALLHFFPRAFSWFGNLPGDVRISRGNTRIFIPITSMLLVSGGLTLLLNLIAWLIRQWR